MWQKTYCLYSKAISANCFLLALYTASVNPCGNYRGREEMKGRGFRFFFDLLGDLYPARLRMKESDWQSDPARGCVAETTELIIINTTLEQ